MLHFMLYVAGRAAVLFTGDTEAARVACEAAAERVIAAFGDHAAACVANVVT